MNLIPIIPEIIVVSTSLILLIADITIPNKYRDYIGYISLAGLITALACSLIYWNQRGFVLNTLSIDELTSLIRIAIIVAGILINLTAIKNSYTISHNQGEFFSLLLFSIAGTMILAGSRDLITMYVGLELSTIPSFILVAFRKARAKAGEALVKFFILGVLSSAFLVYGLSLVYGLTGHVELVKVAQVLAGGMSPTLAIASLLVIAGFGFKITAVPFHFWAPDTYEGAPVVVVSYLATVSKLGAFAALGRLFAEGLLVTSINWGLWFGVLASVTMTLGNLMALPQNNIKRMMAYSGVGHAGYLLVGLAVGTNFGIQAMYFYLIAYVFSTAVVFFVIIAHHTGRGESDAISGYRGMAQTNATLALVMVLAFLSLVGIPPFAGFFGKLYLSQAAIANNQAYLAILIFVNSVISLAYYIKVIKFMYLKEPDTERKHAFSPFQTSMALGIATFIIIYVGVIQEPIHRLTVQIFSNIKM